MRVFAGREVILAGGAINSPQLLMLSGIGDPAELRNHGIETKVPLGGVGRIYRSSVGRCRLRPQDAGEIPPRDAARTASCVSSPGLICLATALRAMCRAASLPSSRPDLDPKLPDVQFLFRAGSLAAQPYLPPFLPSFADTFGCRWRVVAAKSRGRVSLASADPRAPMRISLNFLSAEDDLKVLRAGIAMAVGRGSADATGTVYRLRGNPA